MSVCIFHNIMQTASSLHYLLELLLINKYRYTSENKKVTPIYLFIRKISHTSSWTQYCFMWTWFVSVWERGVKIGWIDRFIFAMKRFFPVELKDSQVNYMLSYEKNLAIYKRNRIMWCIYWIQSYCINKITRSFIIMWH